MPLLFSYGSNSRAQLSTRVKNDALRVEPAQLYGYARIFCLASERWGEGGVASGVASLYPSTGAITLGTVAHLTDTELTRLDEYEKSYQKHELCVDVHRGGSIVKETATAYIGTSHNFIGPPSEPYLCAIHVMLREQWSAEHTGIIEINCVGEDGRVKFLRQWAYPGSHALGLHALVVEANARKSQRWEMPKTIGEIVAKLAAVGVTDVAELKSRLERQRLNAELEAAEQTPFSPETLEVFSDLLDVRSMSSALARSRIVGGSSRDEGARAKQFADSAESIERLISSGHARTAYMHRSPDSEGRNVSAHGDIIPHWVARARQYYGSMFGRVLTSFISNKDLQSSLQHGLPPLPTYYTDCSGFVRELLSSVFPPYSEGFDPKAPLLEQSALESTFGHEPRAYPRASVFFDLFEDSPFVEHCVPGVNTWGQVADAAQLRRGDVVVYATDSRNHTGHVWVVVSDPDANGFYDSVESTSGGRNGICRVTSRNIRVIDGQHRIGRLVEAARPPDLGGVRYRALSKGAIMRLHQELDSREVASIYPGQVVTAFGSDENRRVKVETTCGVKGWVTRKFVDSEDVNHPVEYRHWGCRVRQTGAIVRQWADLADADRNPVVVELRANEPLTQIAERMNVQTVDENGVMRSGWVSVRFFERCDGLS